jgi:hypothetical protein
MSHKLLFSNVFIGGTGVDNPGPLTIANYHLTAAESALTLTDMNVVAFHAIEHVQKQVTGKVIVDPTTGNPKTGPNDVVFMPCPPFCYL